MTPAELNLYEQAEKRRREDDRRFAEAYIYSLAALIRPMVWAKRPPLFERVFPEREDAKKPMTDEQMYAQVVALNRMFGGEEVD